jgi:hypothetical protein
LAKLRVRESPEKAGGKALVVSDVWLVGKRQWQVAGSEWEKAWW